jgi:hypothetical protein
VQSFFTCTTHAAHHTTCSGCHVRSGRRQSIPSSSIDTWRRLIERLPEARAAKTMIGLLELAPRIPLQPSVQVHLPPLAAYDQLVTVRPRARRVPRQTPPACR